MDLTGKKPSEVACEHCEGKRIAIWKDRACVYSYSGKVDYPMGNTPHGTLVGKGEAKWEKDSP